MSESSSNRAVKDRVILSAAAAVTGSAALYLWWRWRLERPLPAGDEQFELQGLTSTVEIIRDRWGVPHIYAQNDHDLFFAQGFVHAQDRLFQMDTLRRVGSGRLSEIIGPSALAGDRVARYFGWTRAAQAQVQGAGPEVNKVMAAYCAGINAYISHGKLPVEFSLLGYKPEPWQFIDTAALGAVLAWGLAVNWESELVRRRLLMSLGAEKAVGLSANIDHGYQLIMAGDPVDPRNTDALLDAYHQAMEYMPLGDLAVGRSLGSNNWALDGRHTVSGRPILANDPHLPAMMPALWYENHLVGGDYQVTGMTMPGVPGVVIGHNRRIAWGLTNAFPDVQDVYFESFHPEDPGLYEVEGQWVNADLVQETIKIRRRKAVVENVRYTRHGPVFSDFLPEEKADLALCWASHTAHDHLQAVLDMNRASDWEEFRAGLSHWGFPSQNVVYADVAGNIGYMMPGRVPLRREGNGLLPVPGWTNAHEWAGWIPFNELPSSFNPLEGFIVTANNRVHGRFYPHLLTAEWLPDYRARRIADLIQEKTPLTLEDNAQIQADILSLQAVRFLQAALPVVEDGAPIDNTTNLILDITKKWNGEMRVDQVAPTIFFGWFVHFTQAAITQAVGPDLAAEFLRKNPPELFSLDPFLEEAGEVALGWLERGGPDWIGEVKPLLLPALRKTLALLAEKYGSDRDRWTWGRLHRIEFKHPLARLPGVGRTWKPISIPVGGDGFTVNQAEVAPHFPPGPATVIASCRLLIDVGAWDNCLAVLPGGQSGHPASDHYQDSLYDWRAGRYHPLLFSRERIEAAMEKKLVLSPAG